MTTTVLPVLTAVVVVVVVVDVAVVVVVGVVSVAVCCQCCQRADVTNVTSVASVASVASVFSVTSVISVTLLTNVINSKKVHSVKMSPVSTRLPCQCHQNCDFVSLKCVRSAPAQTSEFNNPHLSLHYLLLSSSETCIQIIAENRTFTFFAYSTRGIAQW